MEAFVVCWCLEPQMELSLSWLTGLCKTADYIQQANDDYGDQHCLWALMRWWWTIKVDIATEAIYKSTKPVKRCEW
jgi:hypothetical protein